MQRLLFSFIFAGFILLIFASMNAKGQDFEKMAVEKTRALVNEIAKKSFPEIKLKKIRIKTFKSDKSYFKARFSVTRYLTFQRMRHFVFVNPEVFKRNASEEGIRSIIAHELSHILFYTEKNRFELLGLAGLTSGSFEQKFERKTDLIAIQRGYGKGLIEFRRWLYRNVPASNLDTKKKNYFSPNEIELIMKTVKVKPEMFEIWRKKVPKNIDEIKKSIE